MHLFHAGLTVNLVDAESAVTEKFVFEMRMVGDVSTGATLDSGHQLHTAGEDGFRRQGLNPFHQFDSVRVIEFLEKIKG